MEVYRLTEPRFSSPADVLLGEGARRAGGRWNRPGTPLVYCSLTPELALLELLVHVLQDVRNLPPLLLHTIFLPDDAITVWTPEMLPPRWREIPVTLAARVAAFFSEKNRLALQLPSVVSPLHTPFGYNVLVEPLHPRMKEVSVLHSVPVYSDPRLTGGRPWPGDTLLEQLDDLF